jgi:hypothetical protein
MSLGACAPCAVASLGSDFGLSEGISAALGVVGMSLSVWKTIDSQSLQRKALQLQEMGVRGEQAVAMETLAIYKQQLEMAEAGDLGAGGVPDYAVPIGIGVVALLGAGMLFFGRK